VLFGHDPANECLVTGLFRFPSAKIKKLFILVFLTEAPGILRLRLTITYHEGRGSVRF
jgi:hypothetical protein